MTHPKPLETKPGFPPRVYASPCRMADIWNKCAMVGVATIPIQGDVVYLSEIESDHREKEAYARGRAEAWEEVVVACGQHWSVYKLERLAKEKAKAARAETEGE